MSAQKNKTILAVTIAVIAVFLLGGVSFTFFPIQQSLQQNLPAAAHIMWTRTPAADLNFTVTGPVSTSSSSNYYYFAITRYYPMDTICIDIDGNLNVTNAPIQHQGNTYTLTGNIVNQTILLQKDNIILDGAGYTLQGWCQIFGDQATGISIANNNNVTVTDLNIQQFAEPFWLRNSTDVTIKNSNITQGYPYAILMEDSNKNSVVNNSFVGSMVALVGCSDNQILDNTFSDGNNGVAGYSSSNNNLIINNSFTSVNDPIQFEGVGSTISRNTIVNGDYGISVDGGQSFNISKNTIANCTTAFSLNSLSGRIYENNVLNSSIAVQLNSYDPQTGNNTFYYNNFIKYSQSLQTLSPGNYTDRWDNDKEGNYWSSYNGSDNNGDGIGDIPYNLATNCTDNYPLMQPYTVATTNVELGNLFFVAAAVTTLIGAAVIVCVYAKFRGRG